MKRKFNKSYVLSVSLLVLLVSGAFQLPKITLNFQDYKAMEDIRFSLRTGIDYEALNTEYETDVYRRLRNFAEGNESGKQYFITTGENGGDYDEAMLLDSFFKIAADRSMAGDPMDVSVSDVKLNKQIYYVIYDQDANNGAALLCWYVEFEVNDASMVLLVDAKDATCYYIEMYDYNTANMRKFYEKGAYGYGVIEDMLWNIAGYYGTEPVNELEAQINGIDGAVSEEKSYESIITNYDRFKKMADGGLSASLYYEGSQLHYDVYYTDNEKRGYPGIAMGIREIRNILPKDDLAEKFPE